MEEEKDKRTKIWIIWCTPTVRDSVLPQASDIPASVRAERRLKR